MKGRVMNLRQHISKRIIAVTMTAVLGVTTMMAGSDLFVKTANAAGVKTATVSYTAQYDGAFKDVKINTSVSSDTAENMGYEDSVAAGDGVSLLDVWVQIHKDIFPSYNSSNKDNYFSIANTEYGVSIMNAYAKGGSSVGYYKNGAMAYGLSETVVDGDVVDTFYYQDTTAWSDSYSHFINVALSDGYIEGNLVRDGYDESYNLVTMPVAGVDLGWLNTDTLELINANPYGSALQKTSADGGFSIAMPNTSGNYLLTVYDGTVDGVYLVRTLCVEYPTTPKVVPTPKSLSEETDIYNAAGKYLADTNKQISYGDAKEGYLIGLGRANYPVSDGLYTGYYDSVKSYLAGNGGKFDSVTECAKVVAALNAIGYDPTNIDGIDITKQLSDTSSVSGVYANAYALIALDTKNYPSDARDTYINNLVNVQLSNGAWGWNGSPDNDTTGMVLAAFAPYYNKDSAVTNVVNKALDYLSNAQASDGAFRSGMDENSNSTAMVVLGLSELGINADTDSRFVKNGVSAVDALCSYAVAGGGFGWTDNTDVNDYATYQSYYALCSYFRCINGKNRLFDMTAEKASADSDSGTTKVPKVPKTGDRLF